MLLKQMENPWNGQVINILNHFLLPNKKPLSLQISQIVTVKGKYVCLPLIGKIGKLNTMFYMRADIKIVQLLRELPHKKLHLINELLLLGIIENIGLQHSLLAQLQEANIETRRISPQSSHHCIGT